jgi:hypothetical protein
MKKKMFRAKLFVSVIVLLTLLTSCINSNPSAFDRGIRLWSLYDVVDTPPFTSVFLMTIPAGAVIIPGVGHEGHLIQTNGAPGPRSGADTTLSGETGQFGFEDHEFIRDNADWQLSVSYLGVIPGCGTKSADFHIPQGGQQIYAVCFLH